MKKKSILLLLISLLIFGCNSNKEPNYQYLSKKVDSIADNSPNAIDVLEKEMTKKKIIFIGCANHSTINDVQFLCIDNLQRLYNKGLRYILCEGGLPDKFVYEQLDLEKEYIKLFYPWESVGALFYENTLFNNILKINSDLPIDDQIKVIGLESMREEFYAYDNDEEKIMNYRDEYMFKTAEAFWKGIIKVQKLNNSRINFKG